MRLLADSFLTTRELNDKGFALYADFRPDVSGWGQRAEIRCKTILEGRMTGKGDVSAGVGVKGEVREGGLDGVVKYEDEGRTGDREEPPQKRAKDMTVEEYEAALDASEEFEDFIHNLEY